MWRIVLRGPADARWELTGWETAGAYLIARPDGDAWTILRTAAGRKLAQVELLLALMSAEIVLGTDAGR